MTYNKLIDRMALVINTEYRVSSDALRHTFGRRVAAIVVPLILEEAARVVENSVTQECCRRPHRRVTRYSEHGEPLEVEEECCGSPNLTPQYPEKIAAALRAMKE